MGEWSEYYEDFPEENPANWVNGQYDPHGATAQRAAAERTRQVLLESKAFKQKLDDMANAARRAALERISSEQTNDA